MACHVRTPILLAASLLLAGPSLAATDAAEQRKAAAALLQGPGAPTPETLLRAHVLAGAADRLAPLEPWGQAARCDLARRWGDPQLTARCVAALASRAPGHDETRRALDLQSQASHGTRLLAGWLLLLVVVALSLRRAWRRARRPSPSISASSPAAAVVLVCLLAVARSASAAPAAAPAPIVVNDLDPESTLPTAAQRDANPLEFGYHLQELIARAEAASQRADHRAAARFYRALAKAVPDRSTAFGKLCASLEAAGDRAGALAACRAATALPGVTVADFTRFVQLTLARPGDLTSGEIAEARSAVLHLAAQPEAALAGHRLACELALRAKDLPLLESCTKALAAAAPDDLATLSFEWALAVRQGDRERAEALVARAQKAGLGAQGVARMKQGTLAIAGGGWGWLLDWRLLILILLALLVAAVLRRALRPAALPRATTK